MPLLGVGIDVVEVARVARLLERYGTAFERRWFAPDEALWARRAGRPEIGFSALLAGKESVWKSLGVIDDGPVPWRSIHVLPDAAGGKVTLPDGWPPRRRRSGSTSPWATVSPWPAPLPGPGCGEDRPHPNGQEKFCANPLPGPCTRVTL
ncbi:4'-phosphopantetheinyl transferase superfamily protein [Ornithinimicrobium sp. CNJ-824]|uniref:4'-phosphopantetheinyl transferase superfamily protein n=1 Tax=Ornithinimicrobium sp. CNJ-824 TaxID=1904966 RepID=UPI00096AB3B7